MQPVGQPRSGDTYNKFLNLGKLKLRVQPIPRLRITVIVILNRIVNSETFQPGRICRWDCVFVQKREGDHGDLALNHNAPSISCALHYSVVATISKASSQVRQNIAGTCSRAYTPKRPTRMNIHYI